MNRRKTCKQQSLPSGNLCPHCWTRSRKRVALQEYDTVHRLWKCPECRTIEHIDRLEDLGNAINQDLADQCCEAVA